MRPNLKKPFTKIGLVERLKVKALSSSPSTAKEKKKKRYPQDVVKIPCIFHDKSSKKTRNRRKVPQHYKSYI
jgi:hypothetical protein